MTTASDEIDVVIVGAGPVGLLTAIELTLGGARVLVLEQLSEPSSSIKAMGIGPLGVEAMQRRGMADAIGEAEASLRELVKRSAERTGPDARFTSSKFIGHFAGLSLIRRDAQKEPDRLFRRLHQQSVEAILMGRTKELDIEVRRNCTVTGFMEHENSVEVTVQSPDGNSTVKCSWLVGCDGGRSSIRKMAGFEFPGTPPTLTLYQAIAHVDHPERLGKPGWRRTAHGVFSYGPFPGRIVMIDFRGPPPDRDAPVATAELEAVLRYITEADVRVTTIESASRWTDNTRLVDTFRKGRILLAGDAAHVHTPFGGQGLSLGLVDAANLGWKLSAVVRGEKDESFLDSYSTERHAAADAVLANTLAQTAIMRPDAQAGAMRDLIAKMMDIDEVNRFFGEMMHGLTTRYDLDSDHDEVGRLISDREIGGEVSESWLYDLMQDGSGVLLDATPDRSASAVVQGITGRVRCAETGVGTSMLIRPDACVAWVGEGSDLTGLEAAVRRWW